jgi:transketolase
VRRRSSATARRNKQGKEACHGAALGKDEVAAARASLGWNHPPFVVPDDYYDAWNAEAKGAEREATWNALFSRYRNAHPDLAAEYERRMGGKLPDDFAAHADAYAKKLQAEGPSLPHARPRRWRLDAFGPKLPELIGGSADLAGSNLTIWKGIEGRQHVRRIGQLLLLRRARIRHERDQQRPGAARRLHSVRSPRSWCSPTTRATRCACPALIPAHAIHVYTHDSIGSAMTARLTSRSSTWRACA